MYDYSVERADFIGMKGVFACPHVEDLGDIWQKGQWMPLDDATMQ